MKTYTLKLVQNASTAYSLYDGSSLVSDSDLATLFATAGEAYFVFDFNSLTPMNRKNVIIVNSLGSAVITTGTQTEDFVAEGKNFKGEWGASATTFTSFTQLSAYGLDESQLSALVSKMGEGKEIITKEITANVNAWSFFGGSDAVGKIFRVRNNTNDGKQIYFDRTTSGSDATKYVGLKESSDTYFVFMLSSLYNLYSFVAIEPHGAPGETGATNAPVLVGGFYAEAINNPQISRIQIGAIDNLTTTSTDNALSANQGRVLNTRIGDLSTLTTTAKTSAVAAINEVVGSIGDIETVLATLTTGTGV